MQAQKAPSSSSISFLNALKIIEVDCGNFGRRKFVGERVSLMKNRVWPSHHVRDISYDNYSESLLICARAVSRRFASTLDYYLTFSDAI